MVGDRGMGHAGGRRHHAPAQQVIELAARPVDERGDLLEALEAAASWGTWHLLRTVQGCSVAQARAVVGRTERHGRTWLKLTLLNPHASTADVDHLVELVAAAGAELRAPEVVA